jgi:scaffold protein (connect acetoacetyl-CoA thiolase and HMG-CoA synthase)
MSTSAAEPTDTPVRAGILQLDPPALLAGRCAACGELRFPATSLCAECGGERIESVALAGEGSLYTFSIVRMAPPGYGGKVPYAVGVVELPDGIRVTATILAEDLDRLAVGDAVTFELLTLPGPDGPLLSFAYRGSA